MGAKSLSCPIEHHWVRGIDLIIIATQNQTAFTMSKSKTDKNIEKNKLKSTEERLRHAQMLSTNEKLALNLVRIRANMMIFRIEKRNQSSQPQSFIRHKNEQSFSRIHQAAKTKGKRIRKYKLRSTNKWRAGRLDFKRVQTLEVAAAPPCLSNPTSTALYIQSNHGGPEITLPSLVVGLLIISAQLSFWIHKLWLFVIVSYLGSG